MVSSDYSAILWKPSLEMVSEWTYFKVSDTTNMNVTEIGPHFNKALPWHRRHWSRLLCWTIANSLAKVRMCALAREMTEVSPLCCWLKARQEIEKTSPTT